MISRKWSVLVLGVAMFAAGFGVRGLVGGEVAHAQSATRVFEMRTYTAAPGKFPALQTRFRDHTLPQGVTGLIYKIRATRSTKDGDWTMFPVNIGG